MTQLRDQLQTLQRAYASARYPGNLADELLTQRRSPMRIVGEIAIATAVAAVLVLALLSSITVTQSPMRPTEIVSQGAIEDTTEETTIMPGSELASFPAFPDDLPLSPSAEVMEIGSMPSFPSLDLSFENEVENTSTTKESA